MFPTLQTGKDIVMEELLSKLLCSIDEKIPEYGTIKIDLYQGKISFVDVTEKHKVQTFKNN